LLLASCPTLTNMACWALRAWAGKRTAQLEATAVLCWHAQLRYEEPTVRQANYDGAAAARVCAFRGVGGGRITIRLGEFPCPFVGGEYFILVRRFPCRF